jgi:hypothetical protein
MTKRDSQEFQHDVEDFLQQLESDRDMRSQVNLFKKKKASAEIILAENSETKEGQMFDDEEIGLDELLEDMELVDDNGEVNQELAEVEVLTASEAAKTNSLNLFSITGESSFDENNFLGKKFSFL